MSATIKDIAFALLTLFVVARVLNRHLYVRVCLSERLYTYRLTDSVVGERIVIPANRIHPWPQVVRVAALGHGLTYFGRVSKASHLD